MPSSVCLLRFCCAFPHAEDSTDLPTFSPGTASVAAGTLTPLQTGPAGLRQEEAAVPLLRTNTRGRPSPASDKLPPKSALPPASAKNARCRAGPPALITGDSSGRTSQQVGRRCSKTEEAEPTQPQRRPKVAEGKLCWAGGRDGPIFRGVSPAQPSWWRERVLQGKPSLGIRGAAGGWAGKYRTVSTSDGLLGATEACAACRVRDYGVCQL